ncbi:hypothetical protein [Azospirillum picis]|uniref:Uncharacterized protein n=1 Tax=Azospirillum picis TaxID=488438 RepID=A0ABU0MNI4_9PROT|nr:hypothetical protein [Azospirillum picis]MBP2300752.1 hypothetical protein [Azospirillum picis]MDQ0534721.1 hypothetical protein [Azospirillum picis]
MQGLDDLDRMLIASLCPSGALIPPPLPPDGPLADQADGVTEASLLSLGLGVLAAILLALLPAVA